MVEMNERLREVWDDLDDEGTLMFRLVGGDMLSLTKRSGRMSQVDLTKIPEVEREQAKARLTKIPFHHGPDHILYFDHQETIDDMIKLQLHGKSIEFDKA